jgi:signal transduction histidine kinase
MTTMLDDLSEVSSFELKGVELHRVACDLSDLLGGIIDDLSVGQARRIEVELATAPPFLVFGDRARLERVIINLLTNALKYSSEDAPVEVLLAAHGNSVELEVTDHGIGIAPEDIELLFKRYFRTAAGKASAGGSGLGLYIASSIAAAHGGHIEVTSEVGKGSRFRLVLPAQSAAA